MAFDLPWEVDGVATINGIKTSAGIYRSIPVDATPDETDEVCRVEYQYADFLVRAVNSHAALVGACLAVVEASNSGADTIGFLVELRRVALLCNTALARCSSPVEQP